MQSTGTPGRISVTRDHQALEVQTRLINQALQRLGKKNLSLIIHGASFPSLPNDDTGIGSPNSQGGKHLLQFLKSWGFNSLQLGPGGKTKSVDASPYVSTTFSSNPLFIDLKPLVSMGLLSQRHYDQLAEHNPHPEQPGQWHRVAYTYVFEAQQAALKEAHRAFKEKINQAPGMRTLEHEQVKSLQLDFLTYRRHNAYWLDRDALYEALAVEHHTDYWPLWPSELDKRLLNPKDETEQAQAETRIRELRHSHHDVMEEYCFIQWLAHRQKVQLQEDASQLGIKLIADRQVGFSDRDVWACQKLFLDGFYLGAPPDYFCESGQPWGFPTLDPQQIFNPDGSLGPAGELLKAVFDKTFAENRGGVRIDHIIGLIDPWVYPCQGSPKYQDGAGRLYSSPEHPGLFAYSRIGMENLNHDSPPDHEHRAIHLSEEQIHRYGEIIRLILQSAEAQGIPHSSIICEDLGTLTNPVKAVMHHMDLSGIRVTQFVNPDQWDHMYRGKNVRPQDWIMLGSHDNMPALSWVREVFEQNRTAPQAELLRQDLTPLQGFEHSPKGDAQRQFLDSLFTNPSHFLTAKFAELFASPAENVQIFFADFFGMDAYYNKPGTGGEENWSLRLPNDFEAYYHQQLQAGCAVNLPEVLKLALEAQGHRDSEDDHLLAELDELAQQLKQADS